MSSGSKPLWSCPRCGRRFGADGQVHTCRAPSELDRHFAGSEAIVGETFDAFIEAVRDVGPFEIVPQTTRIALRLKSPDEFDDGLRDLIAAADDVGMQRHHTGGQPRRDP